jgi:predicted dithiol-disulfide oxidoreductase (DUF899 family)
MKELQVDTREEWLAARIAPLADEKELTARSDALARKRQALPWVPVEKDYSFEADDGRKRLAELFEGRSQVAVSRAPLENLQAYKRRMGWGFPWVSAAGSDFNLDFAVCTEEGRQTGAGFNFGTPKHAEEIDLRRDELHGLSAFALQDGVVHHTYSCYDRGTDALNATWQLLDRTPKGRGDDPKGWPRRHDEYAND